MKIRLYGWHGTSPKLRKMVAQRLNVDFENNSTAPLLNMTTDEFMSKWKDKVIFMPDEDHNEMIAGITEHSNFGQR